MKELIHGESDAHLLSTYPMYGFLNITGWSFPSLRPWTHVVLTTVIEWRFSPINLSPSALRLVLVGCITDHSPDLRGTAEVS